LRINLRISGWLRVIIVALAGLSVAAYCLIDEKHPYINGSSVALISVFGAVLYAVSGRYSTKFPSAILVTLLLIIFVQSRLFVLIIYPESLLHNSRVSYAMLNTTMMYIIAGTVCCYLGCAAAHVGYGGLRSRVRRKVQGNGDQAVGFFWTAFMISVGLTLAVYYSLGYAGATGGGAHLGFFQRYVARLVAPTAWLIMFLPAYMLHHNRRAKTYLLITAVGTYIIGLMLQGSRSGVFESLALLLAAKVLLEGNFVLLIRLRHLLLTLLALPVGLLSFQIPTQLRAHWYDSNFSIAVHLGKVLSGETPILEDETMISDISYRLSFIEPTLFPIFASDLGLNDVSDLVNPRTTALLSINRLIPGKPLGDILFTEYAFGYMYEENGVMAYSEDGRVDRVGYEWSVFGISYQLFGFYGGCLFILMTTALLVKTVRVFTRRENIYGFSFGLYFMTIFIVWIRNLGIDNLIDRTVHGFAVLVIYAAIYWVITRGAKAGFGRAYASPS
jgi:hypothetical protein